MWKEGNYTREEGRRGGKHGGKDEFSAVTYAHAHAHARTHSNKTKTEFAVRRFVV